MSQSYVPIEELANHLSVKVTTIRDWVNKGYIPKDTYIKVANTYRFNIPDVIAALKQEAPEPIYDSQNEPVQLELNFCDEDDV